MANKNIYLTNANSLNDLFNNILFPPDTMFIPTTINISRRQSTYEINNYFVTEILSINENQDGAVDTVRITGLCNPNGTQVMTQAEQIIIITLTGAGTIAVSYGN